MEKPKIFMWLELAVGVCDCEFILVVINDDMETGLQAKLRLAVERIFVWLEFQCIAKVLNLGQDIQRLLYKKALF